MASRDLTKSFLEHRSAAKMRRRSSDDKKGTPQRRFGSDSYKKLTAGGTDELFLQEEGGIQMTSFNSGGATPGWVSDIDAIHEVVADIQRKIDLLSNMHATRVGSVFGKDLDDMEGRIERMTNDITDRLRYAEKLLKKVGGATRKAGGEEATVGANAQRSLAKKLQEMSSTFRQKQRKYLADVQAQKGLGFASGDSKFAGMDLNGGSGGDLFTTQQLTVVDDLTTAVASRDEEIIKIAQSIEELGNIFKELAVLVIDQGTILDRIDYNMEAVVENTKTGIQQLERAEKAQQNARPLKCIFCLLVTILILLFLLILKHKRW